MNTVRVPGYVGVSGILTFWVLFVMLSLNSQIVQANFLNAVGFLALSLTPGALILLGVRIKGLPLWITIGMAVALSLLSLMLAALAGNAVLPYAGIAQPLEKTPLLAELSLVVALLSLVAFWRLRDRMFAIHLKIAGRARDWFIAFSPIMFLVLSILGAVRLNNGASNILTLIMLGGMASYLTIAAIIANTLEEKAIPTGLFFVAASLLLMTSLRGWFITGHDIQTEYKVFELIKNAGYWNIALYRDPYNACLSITILPTVFYNLLKVSDPYIYKFFFQIFFAFSSVITYHIARLWTSARSALLSTIFFIGFPTFFTDMPFLVRQETAFLFFALMVYILFDESIDLFTRRIVFMILGAGVILSHYSTTYTVLLIFILVALTRPFALYFLERFKGSAFLLDSPVRPDTARVPAREHKITFWMIAGLLVLSFVWTSIITNTGGHLTQVLEETLDAVTNGFGDNNRSIDVATLLTFGTPSQKAELDAYIKNVAGPIRTGAPAGTYYPESSYNMYTYSILENETVPYTQAGSWFKQNSVDMSTVMTLLGQLLQKSLEVLAPVGILFAVSKKYISKRIDLEFYLILLYCLLFISLNIILPVLSVEYGIFRAMQQSLFVIAPIIIIGLMGVRDSITAGSRFIYRTVFGGKKAAVAGGIREPGIFVIGFASLFFLYSSHFLPYLFGNAPAVLHLSNYGTYYDSYLIQASEVFGVEWLNANVETATGETNGVRIVVQADRYSQWKFASLTSLSASNDLYPGLIRTDGYVFLDPITVQRGRAATIYNSDTITYLYPTQFLDDNKDLIYDNGGSEVYR